MQGFGQEVAAAFGLIFSANPDLWGIVLVSLKVSLLATLAGGAIGLPLGAALAVSRFPGRRVFILGLAALTGMPPVVVGLGVYLVLAPSGPLGVLDLLYTPAAMVIAQMCLVTPIVAAMTCRTIERLHAEYRDQLRSLGVSGAGIVPVLLWEGRRAGVTALMTGFGRAVAEVGAVIIVGGHIGHVTRTMTTTIALETSRGSLAMVLALGLVLATVALGVTAGVSVLAARSDRESPVYA